MAPHGQMEEDEAAGQNLRVGPPWRLRGQDISRVLALSDGIFAFAMTLLVLSLVLPAGAHGAGIRSYLLSESFLGPLYGYAITFFVIALWWQGHVLVFSYIRHFDRGLLRWNTIFLLFIAIFPFATQVLSAAGNDAIGPVFFSLLQVGAGLALGATWSHASRGDRLVHPGLPPSWKRDVTRRTFLIPIVFAISIPVALIDTRIAEILWLGVFAMLPAFRWLDHPRNREPESPP